MHSIQASLPKTSPLRTAVLLSALLLAAAASTQAGAADYGKDGTRLYVGGAIGRSSYSLPSSSRVPACTKPTHLGMPSIGSEDIGSPIALARL